MKKITDKQVNQLASHALAVYGNPYIKRATAYNIDGIPHYLYIGRSWSHSELDLAYLETASKDIRAGYDQRGVGYYDKWYRYNHADNGAAYDLGCELAAKTPGCKDLIQIIECMH